MATNNSEMPLINAADAGGGVGGGSGGVGNGVDSGNPVAVVSSGPQSNGSCGGGIGESNGANNTISAAADSSDNQPGTPQPNGNGPMMSNNNNSSNEQQHQLHLAQNAYDMYGTVATTTNGSLSLPPMFGGGGGGGGIYATAGGQADMQQQQAQAYPSYMNSFEQFYQQQQQQQVANGMEFGLMYAAGGNTSTGNYKMASAHHSNSSQVRYQPYLNATKTSKSITTDGRTVPPEQHNVTNGNGVGGNVIGSLQLSQSSAAVSTTTNSLSPRMVSSTSPTSTSTHHQQSAAGSTTGSPNSAGGKLVCKKCGFQGTNDNELQEHITNVHGASPYGSSGYASSPYIKEELSSGSQQQSGSAQQAQGGNPGEILDLDSQKMVYPPAQGSIQSLLQQPPQMHDPLGTNDPLHSMHTMQQRALPGWEQPPDPPNVGMQEGLPPYMQQQPQPTQLQTIDQNGKPPHANQSPYYSPKQSSYQVPGGMQNGVNGGAMGVKEAYGMLKSEYPDSQNYVDKSFGSTVVGDMCHQQQQQQQHQQTQPQPQPQLMPVSSSPAEFPTTTTGPQEPQQPYRGFEPPTSSSVNTGALPTKAATWKSNEARRPKTYNCTACNKWFTSSGHLKRHYNTTLHKNAVKSSGQPDPATLPISVHHHPARDPTTTTKPHSRRSNAAAAAAAAAQKQAAAAVQPAELPRSPSDFGQPTAMGMSHYTATPSPTHQAPMNGLAYGANPSGYQPAQQQQQQAQYMNPIHAASNGNSPNEMSASSHSPTSNNQTVLNGHPNGLAGPSAQIALTPMPSSHTRGLLSKTTTTTKKSEPEMEDNYPHNSSNSFNNTLILCTPPSEPEMETGLQPWELVPLETEVRMQMDMEISQQQQQQQLEEEAAATAAVAAEQAQAIEVLMKRHRQAQAALEREEHLALFPHHQLVEEDQQRSLSSCMPMVSPQLLSPPITSPRQQYQAPQQQQQQQPADNHFSLMQPPVAIHTQQQANTMDHQYNINPLDTSTLPPLITNMQLLQPLLHTTTNNSSTTATTVNTDRIRMLRNHLLMEPHLLMDFPSQYQHRLHMQQIAQAQQDQPVLPSMHSMLHNNTNIQSPVHHPPNTITPPQLLQPNTTTITLPQQQQQPQPPLHTTSTIQYYQQLLEGSQLVPLEPTMTYRTIIGSDNSEESLNNTVYTINGDDCIDNDEIILTNIGDSYSTAAATADGTLQTQQLVTVDGQILEFMTTPGMAQPLYAVSPRAMSCMPRSPQAGDLPPAYTLLNHGQSMSHDHLPLNGATQQTYKDEPYTTIQEYFVPASTITSAQVTADTENTNVVVTKKRGRKTKSKADTVAVDDPSEKPKQEIMTISEASTEVPTTTTTAKRKRKPAQSKAPAKPRRKQTPKVITTSPEIEVLPNGRLKCLECERDFTKKCYLTQHLNSIHGGEYKFRCEKCGKRFLTEAPYKKHIGRHSMQNKRWPCMFCPCVFHFKTDWERHIMTKHTGRWTHRCPICRKGFSRNDHMRKHILTHLRNKRKRSKKQAKNAKVKVEVVEETLVEVGEEPLVEMVEEPLVEVVEEPLVEVPATQELVSEYVTQELLPLDLVTQTLAPLEIATQTQVSQESFKQETETELVPQETETEPVPQDVV
ncbi:uncharacterized protein LOC101458935 isoform X2 [Ceratitis capitata]|nr:uncharacterized protein LOC101458935 isoform X2 [Ceratitis capitata]